MCTIAINEEKKGIELSFEIRPTEAIREALKEAGFRWHNMKKLWYAKQTPERMELAEKLSAETMPAVQHEGPAIAPAIRVDRYDGDYSGLEKERLLALLQDLQKTGTVSPGNYTEIEKFIADLQGKILIDNAAKAGKSTVCLAKSAAAIIKTAKKNNQRNMSGGWIGADGAQYVCDGHRALKINTPLALENLPDDVQPLDASKFFVDMPSDAESFPLPDLATLKSMIKTAKAEAKLQKVKNPKIVYSFGPLVINAEYLADAIQATGASELLTTKGNKGNYINPCHLKSDDCTALVLPIKADDGINHKNSCYHI